MPLDRFAVGGQAAAIPSSNIPFECKRCDVWISLGKSSSDRFVACSDAPSLCNVASVLSRCRRRTGFPKS
jgi:hypothetical protein